MGQTLLGHSANITATVAISASKEKVIYIPYCTANFAYNQCLAKFQFIVTGENNLPSFYYSISHTFVCYHHIY